MEGNSRSITTNQKGVHENLEALVKKHLAKDSKKPIQPHTQKSFEKVLGWLENTERDIILDSCCGIGESTYKLAQMFPESMVIGLDKSVSRLNKHSAHFFNQDDHDSFNIGVEAENDVFFFSQENYCLIRADVADFWRLLCASNYNVSKHCLFYPNPYPKSAQIQKRWHGNAAFKDIVYLGGELRVRSNWLIYLEEFQQALAVAGTSASVVQINEPESFTPFERKYRLSGQNCWELTAQLNAVTQV